MNEPALQNATPIEIFKPSANQEKWLDTAIQSDSEQIKDIAEACGIDRTQWYRWIKEPGFIEWYRTEWERRFAVVATKLDMIGMRMAKRDPKVLEIMMRRVGTLTEGPKTLQQFNMGGGKNGNTITFVNFKHGTES